MIAAQTVRIAALLALFAASPAVAQSDLLPLRKGTYWIYAGTVRWTFNNSNRVGSKRLRWKMEVVETTDGPNFHAALIRGAPWDLGWYEPGRDRGDYAIVSTADSTYLLHDEAARGLYALLKRAGLTGDTREKLADNIWFRKPMRPNGRYCAPDQEARTDSSYCWFLDEVRRTQLHDIRGVRNRSYITYTLVFRTLPDHEILDLVPGIGIVRWEFQHHGTVAEANIRLVEFHLGE